MMQTLTMYEAPVPGKYISTPLILCTLLMRMLWNTGTLSREHGHDVVRVFKVRLCIVNDKA